MTLTFPVRTASVDVVIPTYNNLAQLQQCLSSLASDVIPERVLVCVDGSTDGTVEWLRGANHPFEIVVLRHSSAGNRGRAAARNLAVAHLRARITLLLDSDMVLAPGALLRHIALVDSADVVSIGAVVYDNASTNVWARYLATRGRGKSKSGSTLRPLDFVTANAALRTDHLVETGGFDDSIRVYGGEDTEFALRLAQRRLAFVFNAEAAAHTHESKTIAEGLAELDCYARTNLPLTRARHANAAAPFWIDRLESPRWRDRLLRACLNPVSDRVADLLLPRAPFAIQRLLLNYKVIRTVFRGYAEATR